MSLGNLSFASAAARLDAESGARFDLLAGGAAAFERIVKRIDGARRSIALRAFEWRDDATGDLIGRSLLRAAQRGVRVHILKDRVGSAYEHLEGTKQSFFHKQLGVHAHLQAWVLMAAYGRWGSLRQKPNPTADALLAHPNVTVARDEKRYDHAKLYVFDDEAVILGGMGIGDDFRLANVDFMVEVSGRSAVERLADRYEGRAAFDGNRSYDFLLHAFSRESRNDCALADERLALIASTRERLTVEMAYFGDRDCTEALVAAVRRGVIVTILTAGRANVLGDLNRATCSELLRRTGSPDNLRIHFHPRMVHGKAMVGDGVWVDVGSTNFTSLSHGGYEEVDLFCRDRELAHRVEQAIAHEIRAAQPAALPIRYRRSFLAFERLANAVHSKTGKRQRAR